MKLQLRTTLISLFEPRSIILFLALLNFVHIWNQAQSMSGIACFVCPWYIPWTFTNEPTLLLLAAIFLRFGKPFASALACILSGYVIANYVYLFSTVNITLLEHLQYLQKNAREILVLWDTQHLFATLIFGFTLFYLICDGLRKGALK